VNQNQADTVQSDVAACVVYNSNGREMYILGLMLTTAGGIAPSVLCDNASTYKTS